MSLGFMANQQSFPQEQQQQQEQQHPLLSAILGNNYAQTQRVHYYPNHYYPSNYFPTQYHIGHHGIHGHQGLGQLGQLGQQQGQRPSLLAAASNHNGAYTATSGGSGHSGYGAIEPSVEYEVQHDPPTGSFSSYHSSAGSAPAYPPSHHHQPPHPPPQPAPTKSSKKSKKSSASVMNALTLLSFFFFVNMLQNCLKDHMADMNPTVMVLTASGTRNRFNKLAEMNSREQTSTTATESVAEAASSWNQDALVPADASSAPPLPSIVVPTVVLQSPYSVVPASTNKPHHHRRPHRDPYESSPHGNRPHIDDDDDDYNYGHRRPPPPLPPSHTAGDFYPNRTHIDHSSRPDFESESGSDYYQHHYNPYSYTGTTNSRYGSRHPWSYGRQRYSSAPWSSASLGAQSGVSSYLDNAQRRQGDDDAGNGHGYGYGEGDVDNDDDDDGQQQRRRDDAFYTRTRIN